jgi:hypothetical protein
MIWKQLKVVPLLAVLATISGVPAHAADPLLTVGFGDYTSSDGSVVNWLEQNGFTFERAADNPRKIALSHADGALQIAALQQTFGVIYKEMEVPGAESLRLTWGVNDFPDGASYAKGVNNEALMVYVFFGKETMPSGSMIIPDVPYFIGLYLCDADGVDQPYTGRYHEDSGRFVCLGRPAEGERVTSEINLAEAFEAYFGISPMPTISGFSLEVDTGKSGNGGVASAFIESIEFLP